MAVWLISVDVADVWQDTTLSFTELRDEIVKRLRSSDWVELSGLPNALNNAIDCLAAATTEANFDYWWEQLYDIADIDRVWIATF